MTIKLKAANLIYLFINILEEISYTVMKTRIYGRKFHLNRDRTLNIESAPILL